MAQAFFVVQIGCIWTESLEETPSTLAAQVRLEGCSPSAVCKAFFACPTLLWRPVGRHGGAEHMSDVMLVIE